MKLGVWAALSVAVVAAAGGYWIGQTRVTPMTVDSSANHAGTAASEGGKPAREVLYYRNPMGLADTSPTPKKDPMGMAYTPVYAGDAQAEPAAPNQIRISTDKVQKLGVRTEPARLRALDKIVRTAGRVAPDERRVYAIAPKFEGYIERLDVNAAGQSVDAGQPLFEVYSPDLIAAQREYIFVAQSHQTHRPEDQEEHARTLKMEASELTRLRNWDISDDQLQALVKSGKPTRTLTFRSPVSGVVIEKKAVQGMRFLAGEELYRVVDLSTIWVLADVFEQDIGLIKTGAKANVTINAYPDKTFAGTITYVYPTLNPETRTVPVRIEMPNPGQLLKLDMFAKVDMPVGSGRQVVTVPTSAVIDSGTRRIVLVQRGEGRFEPREVTLGQRSESDVEVIAGVKDGEPVVVTANFLIDAESNLRAAVAGFGHASDAATPPQAAGVPAGGQAGAQIDQPSIIGHKGAGTVESIDTKAGTVTLHHGPIESLKWPSMTMEFLVANKALLVGLKPGLAVTFEFVERKPGEWVVTSMTPGAPDQVIPAPAPTPHAGHG